MKKLRFLIIALVIMVVWIYLIISHLKSTQTKKIEAYLQKEGYHDSDILSIRTEMTKTPVFNTTVIFKDEEKVIYYYWKFQDKVHQRF